MATVEKNPGEPAPQEFHHTELLSDNSIRLIQIHAKPLRGEISCSLQHYETDAQTCPDYTALSYVWGDSTPTKTIYINGLVDRVHQSLWEFLSHVQSKGEMERTWYWTDLLCIDQAHHSEKNEQIARMGDVYAQAAQVTSWLGNRDETVEALRVFVDMPELIDKPSEPRYAWRSPESEQIHRACDQLAFKEPYWERVWVLQEVACARNCVVASGDVSLKFEDLLHRMEVAMGRSVRFDSSSDRARRTKRLNALADLKTSIQQKKRIRILELVKMTSFCQATREQDKIYGLLGLASRLDSQFDPKTLEITQHKTLADVWWDIIFMIIHYGSNIGIIKDNMDIVASLIDGCLPPPRMPSAVQIGSSKRGTYASRACLVSKAAYSTSIQTVLGIYDRVDIGDDNNEAIRSQYDLKRLWDVVAGHYAYHCHVGVPCLQISLGWAAYAGLRFTGYDSREEAPEEPTTCLPSGWFCAAHSPDPPSEITKKHLIYVRSLPLINPSSPIFCSVAEHDGAVGRCDCSIVVLKIKSLGITCVVRRPRYTRSIEFYCDYCQPRPRPSDSIASRGYHWPPLLRRSNSI